MTQVNTPEMFRGQDREEAKTTIKPEPIEKVSPELKRLLALSDQIARAQAEQLANVPALQAALRRAALIKVLMQALTDEVMEEFLPLVGTSLGFKTDRDSSQQGYSKDEVRRCMVEALLYGARLTDNEFNIIKGKAYLTREFFTRVLAEDPQMQNLRVDYGVPERHKDGALVPVKATWTYNGVADSLDAKIPIATRDSDSIDNILGKAARKTLFRIHGRVTGSRFVPEGEVEEGGGVEEAPAPAASSTAAKIEALRAKQAAAKATAPETAPFPT